MTIHFISRRNFIQILSAIPIAIRAPFVISDQSICGVFYAATYVGTCDDHRTSDGDTGGSSSGDRRLSRTPYQTWSNEDLRRWDNELARWDSVKKFTADKVLELQNRILNDTDSSGNIQYEEFAKKLGVVVSNISGNYIRDNIQDSVQTEQFWKQINNAKTGWGKLNSVEHAYFQSSRGVLDKENLKEYLNDNGTIKDGPLLEYTKDIKYKINDFDSMLSAKYVNTFQFTSSAVSDALSANSELSVENVEYISNYSNLLTGLFSTGLIRANVIGIPRKNIQSIARGEHSKLAKFYNGFVRGATKQGKDLIDGLKNIITDPYEVAKGIAIALENPSTIIDAIYDSVKNDFNTLIYGTTEERAEVIGGLTFDVISAFMGAAAGKQFLKVSKLGISKTRKITDPFVQKVFSTQFKNKVNALPSSMASLKNHLTYGVDTLFKKMNSAESFFDSLYNEQRMYEDLLKVRYVNGSPVQDGAYKKMMKFKTDLKSVNKYIDELSVSTDSHGNVIGLKEAKNLVDHLDIEKFKNNMHIEDYSLLKSRYEKAFELAKRHQIKGKRVFINGDEIDIRTDDFLIQVSTSEFPTELHKKRWWEGRHDRKGKFRLGKIKQATRTATYAREKNLGSVYWFAKKPPNLIQDKLRQVGIDEIWWDE